MTPSSPSYMSFVFTALLVVGSCAFAPSTASRSKIETRTQLSAWSLRLPPQTSLMAGKWYDEHNPTARRTVYERDDFLDYGYLSFGSDWLSMSEGSKPVKKESNELKVREGVFRRAAKWARRVRRRE